jgi:hypothetical protein
MPRGGSSACFCLTASIGVVLLLASKMYAECPPCHEDKGFGVCVPKVPCDPTPTPPSPPRTGAGSTPAPLPKTGIETTFQNGLGETIRTLETGGRNGVTNIRNLANGLTVTYVKTLQNIGAQIPRT